MKDSPKQQIEYFEQEVKEILGKPPQYLIRWGISIYFLLFCIIVALSVTIDYPVYARCTAQIIPQYESQIVYLRANDKIKDLQVTDGMEINANQPLYRINDQYQKSSYAGTVRFLKPITNGYSEDEIEEVMIINPKHQNYDLSINVPKLHINKVKVGQALTFKIDSKIITGTIISIPPFASHDGTFLVEAKSESDNTFISDTENIMVDVMVNNKKIFQKILNL